MRKMWTRAGPGRASHIAASVRRVKQKIQQTMAMPGVPRADPPVHAVPERQARRDPVLQRRVSDLLRKG